MSGLTFLLFTKRNNFCLLTELSSPIARNFLCRASFVHKPDSRSFTNTKRTRFSAGLRNNFAQVCEILALNFFDISSSSRCALLPESWKPLPRATGSYRLWSPLALVVIVYLGNTFFPTKTDVFLYCLLFKERKWLNGEDGIHWYDSANERRDWNSRGVNSYSTLEISDNEIRILISKLSIKMVALHFGNTI